MEIGRNALEAMLREKTCCLCGEMAEVQGLHMPDDIHAPKNKTAYCAYGLCGECFQKPDKERLVEEIVRPVMIKRLADIN